MSLNLEFFERTTNITARVIADSISEAGHRITTFEIEYPRFIHGELMTHRMLSKNSSSSRAIPINKMLEQIESNMAIPVYWGKNKSGMQAVEEVSRFDEVKSVLNWERSYNYTKERILEMVELGLHKQVPNRLSEPFQMMKVVITGTDWDNFFNLRIHPNAQPEICLLAYKMYKAMQESSPNTLRGGEWHLPYVEISQDQYNPKDTYYFLWDKDCTGTETDGYMYEQRLSLEDAIKYSAASCASVSYRTEGMTLEKADKIFDMLINAEVIHASPFEHLATPILKELEIENSDYLTVGFINKSYDPSTWQKGVTHMNRNGELCSGNLRGFISYRHQLPNNTNWSFDYEERMKLFK